MRGTKETSPSKTNSEFLSFGLKIFFPLFLGGDGGGGEGVVLTESRMNGRMNGMISFAMA